MTTLFDRDCVRLFHFHLLFNSLERFFLKFCSFTSVVKRYFCGEKEQRTKVLLVRWKAFFKFVSWVWGCGTWLPRFPTTSASFLWSQWQRYLSVHKIGVGCAGRLWRWIQTPMLLSFTTNSVAVILVHVDPNAVVPPRYNNMVTGHRKENVALMTIV